MRRFRKVYLLSIDKPTTRYLIEQSDTVYSIPELSAQILNCGEDPRQSI
ncbi:hypothetical protein BSM4216_2286 [Bacillus smithii]|nr:hypothetical protein BSM4216_2286 [Bacillus smithii]